MKKSLIFTLTLALCALFFTGCTPKYRIASEDIEIFELYPEEIAILKNPNIKPNSKEKYEAAKYLVERIDFTMTRETKTIDNILYYGDGVVDRPNNPNRKITFNYQYGDHYVRLIFDLSDIFVVRADEIIR